MLHYLIMGEKSPFNLTIKKQKKQTMNTYLRALVMLVIILTAFLSIVFGLHWLATVNPYYCIGVIWASGIILLYISIYQFLKNQNKV